VLCYAVIQFRNVLNTRHFTLHDATIATTIKPKPLYASIAL